MRNTLFKNVTSCSWYKFTDVRKGTATSIFRIHPHSPALKSEVFENVLDFIASYARIYYYSYLLPLVLNLRNADFMIQGVFDDIFKIKTL
jgi:hypothetical protein